MPDKLRITAVPPSQAVEILRRSGSRHASTEALQADIEAGAPANPDGTVNLIEFTAWTLREITRGMSLGH